MTPEFSRPVQVDTIGRDGLELEIEANAAERAALAARFGWLAIERLKARLVMRRNGDKQLTLQGRISAALTQACVVSLEPVPAVVEPSFQIRFSGADDGGDIVIDTTESDDVEPMPEGALDLGEIVAQELAVATDPYPRAPGVAALAPPPGDSASSKPLGELAARIRVERQRRP